MKSTSLLNFEPSSTSEPLSIGRIPTDKPSPAGRFSRLLACCFALLPLVLGLVGCGTADYEERLEKSLDAVQKNSKFNLLGSEIKIAGTPVSMRVPATMKLLEATADARRLKPGIPDLPNLKATFEGAVTGDGKGTQHYYLYLMVFETGNNLSNIGTSLLTELVGKFPANEPTNSTVMDPNFPGETPSGQTVTWQEFHFKCPQTFYYPTAQDPQNYITTPGKIIGLTRDFNGPLVILMWRYPASLEPRHEKDFDSDWIKLIAGCLKYDSAAKAE